MRKYYVVGLMAAALVGLVFAPSAFSQGNESPDAKAPEAAAPVEAPAQAAQQGELSVYGEVSAVDAASNSIKVLYYDYDNDEEKTIDFVFDKDTKLENAGSITDIKQLDWVDATYTVKDGKNVAASVIVEKEEEDLSAKAESETE